MRIYLVNRSENNEASEKIKKRKRRTRKRVYGRQALYCFYLFINKPVYHLHHKNRNATRWFRLLSCDVLANCLLRWVPVRRKKKDEEFRIHFYETPEPGIYLHGLSVVKTR